MASFHWSGTQTLRAATLTEALEGARQAWCFWNALPAAAYAESDGVSVRCHTTNVYYRPVISPAEHAATKAVLAAARWAGITDLAVECEHWDERELLLAYRDTWIDGVSPQWYGVGPYQRPTLNEGGLDDYQVRCRKDDGVYDEEEG